MDKKGYNTKLKILLSMLIIMLAFIVMPVTTFSETGDVEINATNFPDANFRTWVTENIDNTDGVISGSTIDNITEIDMSEVTNVENLKGIEFFVNLKKLNCTMIMLKELDVSKNTALETL